MGITFAKVKYTLGEQQIATPNKSMPPESQLRTVAEPFRVTNQTPMPGVHPRTPAPWHPTGTTDRVYQVQRELGFN